MTAEIHSYWLLSYILLSINLGVLKLAQGNNRNSDVMYHYLQIVLLNLKFIYGCRQC